jgi:transposase
MIHKPLPKYTTGFMVAGGISAAGPGKLIFCVGTMDTQSYLRALTYYKQDIDRLNPDLYFQQDNATCHTANLSIDYISENFNQFTEKWPANSPDLNPIEIMWAILKSKLYERKHEDLEDLMKHLVFLWNRIPIGLCKKLVRRFHEKVKGIIDTGERIIKQGEKIKKKKKNLVARQKWNIKWNEDNPDDEVDRIVFNNKTLKENKVRAIKKMKRLIKAENKRWKEITKTFSIKELTRLKKHNWVDYQRALQDKKREKEKHLKALEKINKRIQKANDMDIEEWYESLKNDMRMKMIKFTPLVKKDFQDIQGDGISNIDTQANNIDEENDLISEAGSQSLQVGNDSDN